MIVDDSRSITICGHSGDELDNDFQRGLEYRGRQVRSSVLPFRGTPVDPNTDANLQSDFEPVMQALSGVEAATGHKI